MMLARWNADVTTNVVAQAALAHLLATGGLTRHLKRVRAVYAARLAAMLDDARDGHARRHRVDAAARRPLAFGSRCRPGSIPTRFSQSALDAGMHYSPGDVFCGDGRGGRHLALSFANHTPAEIKAGIKLLGELLRKQLGRAPEHRMTNHRSAGPPASDPVDLDLPRERPRQSRQRALDARQPRPLVRDAARRRSRLRPAERAFRARHRLGVHDARRGLWSVGALRSAVRVPVLVLVTLFSGLHALVHVYDTGRGLVGPEHWGIDFPAVYLPTVVLIVLTIVLVRRTEARP